jgi:hypothetical protein
MSRVHALRVSLSVGVLSVVLTLAMAAIAFAGESGGPFPR